MRVRVPATTANVGSGFDCIGIAVDLYDEIELTPGGEGVRVHVEGEGADTVPRDERHLVVRSMQRGVDEWGDGVLPGCAITCRNVIPHSRGLGSSAAAIVAGLALAWGLSRSDDLHAGELARVSSLIEGHADNAAAAVYGGATLGWIDGDIVDVQPFALHEHLSTKVWIPTFEVPTKGARAVLPERVERSDAVHQAACAATLMLALTQRPELLLRSTNDHLHQRFRADLMQPSFTLMQRLRDVGVPATISGAGPTVFAIGTADNFALDFQVPAEGFRCLELPVGDGVQLVR
ncbi:homoserine kinase [uncultured Tessaracoccus sp.]|uniref:homoserine kinase n=1 Tax=uncultured Tessaracoccus sp. TaxID=905023 RepID=UPI0026051D92|nr:homoserine kinase [uncultured Tessaracoccus sp.]